MGESPREHEGTHKESVSATWQQELQARHHTYTIVIKAGNPYAQYHFMHKGDADRARTSLQELDPPDTLRDRINAIFERGFRSHAEQSEVARELAQHLFVPWLRATLERADAPERPKILSVIDTELSDIPLGRSFMYHGLILELLGEAADRDRIPQECSVEDVLQIDRYRKPGSSTSDMAV
jgi:hypothetical protein